MKKFLKKHKALVIVLVVVGLICWGIGSLIHKAKVMGEEMLASMQSETVTVERRNLVSAVPATGKISSVNTGTVTAEVTGVDVVSVLFAEGDYVNAGDLVCVLSTEDLEKNLAQAEASTENSVASANISVNSASRNLKSAQTQSAVTAERYEQQLKETEQDIKDYENMRDQSSDQYWSALGEANKYKDLVTSTSAKIAALKTQQKSIDPDVSAGEYGTVTSDIATLTVQLNSYQASYAEYNAAASEHLANYNSYVAKIEQLESSKDSVKQNYEDAQRSNESNVAASRDSVASARLSKENAQMTADNQVDQIKEQIEACNVYAPISGIVTSVSVKEGDKYAGTQILTIEDTSAYEIVTEIDEYDIGKIKTGQKVVIKTNGTGDEMLEGHVKSVAPRATVPVAGTTSGNVTYKVVIAVDTKNEALRLDMTAKLSIVLSETDNTLTVPYDSLIYDDDNNPYVEKVLEDGTVENVYVTVGVTNDYYAEVSSENLKEGDTVNVKRDLSEVFDFNALLEEAGAEGGM